MNGMKPKFMETVNNKKFYYAKLNPYVNAPSCNINLLEMSRYAKQNKKRLVDLTSDEVQNFKLNV